MSIEHDTKFKNGGDRTNASNLLLSSAMPCPSAMVRSGRSPDWLKVKNPDVPAVKRSVYCAVLALMAGLMALVF